MGDKMNTSNREKATPRPWHQMGNYIIPPDDGINIARTTLPVATNQKEQIIREEIALANAELIVRAVNSYDENKKTIDDLSNALRQLRGSMVVKLMGPTLNCFTKIIDEALKQAETK
jgi:hypothetical protein